MRMMVLRLGVGLLFGAPLVPAAGAQTPQGTSFTYQGRLTEAGALASGPYDFQFVLFDAPVGGAQVGPTVTLDDVIVTVGLFTVSLDFGSVFGGEKRWLELGVRLGADPGPYTPILPRQEVTPGPSAIFSAAAGDSLQLGGVPASQYVQTDDPRLTDARVPLPGSPDYVQNGSVAQPGVSFNVGGTGTASILDAATQFNLGGIRILSKPGTNNLYVGTGTRAASSGAANTFVGGNAGQTTAPAPIIPSSDLTRASSTQPVRTTRTSGAGWSATTASNNSFFGTFAGFFNTTGGSNSFFGTGAGNFNTTGVQNVFVGFNAGNTNATGDENTFVGAGASQGGVNPVGSANTLLGANARVDFSGISNATAIGNRAEVSQSNSLVLGSILGVNGATASTNVGIGTAFPNARLHVVDGGNILFGGSSGLPGLRGAGVRQRDQRELPELLDVRRRREHPHQPPSGGTIFFRENNVSQVSIQPGGFLNLQSLAGGGTVALCRNAPGNVSTCSSSLRYKADVAPFRGGLDVVERLRPIRFTWKASGQRDIGLAAEEVAEVEPLLAFRNADGQIEGVNYSQLTAVLVNALQQQQAQIDALKALVCQLSRQAAPCEPSGLAPDSR